MVSARSNLRLRPAITSDAPAIAELRNRLAQHFLSQEPATTWRTVDMLAESKTLVAVADGQLIGACSLYNFQGETAEFGRFMVAPEHRGCGKRLLWYAIEIARALRLKRLRLVTKPENGAAAHLYEEVGFKVVSVQMELTL